MNDSHMRVKKRNGSLEDVSFDKILNRVQTLGKESNIQINYHSLIQKVIEQLYDTIPTTKIDELTAEQCASLSSINPDYNILSGRIVISNHQKNTNPTFWKVMHKLFLFKDSQGNESPIISEKIWNIIDNNKEDLESMINHDRDYLIDYFGFKTLEKSYLFRIDDVIVERIQHMWLRVAVCIHKDNLQLVKKTYDLMSLKFFTHATPTLFNAGTNKPQLSSCYLIGMESDSLEGIFDTLKDCAKISKWSGGIGLHIHNIRASNSLIRGTNGKSSGLVPMLKVFNDTARFINQGGKRNGSFSIYLEPWHADIEDFLEMKKNHGDEEKRARDLFYGLWVPDLFMEKVKKNEKWCLFCPNSCPGLSDVYGTKFNDLYNKYEGENKEIKKINARDLWYKILDSQMETGTPYLLFKDAANSKSNQKNIGVIKSSNLCTEIIEYSDEKETAVCNLASVSLPAFVNEEKREFNYEKLHEVVKVITENLNIIIDINFYPTEKTRRSNLLHRPIGIGVQGLADAFIMLDLPFYSEEAKVINKLIFETIYHAALEKSNEMSIERYKLIYPFIKNFPVISDFNDKDKNVVLNKEEKIKKLKCEFENNLHEYVPHFKSKDNFIINYAELLNFYEEKNHKLCGSYSSFIGSPASHKILQYDMWNHSPTFGRYDWDVLKESIYTYGLRNSLLLAPMPTASTSQILGNNECFEPITSNIYSRSTMAGEFIVANKYLMKDLIALGLWDDKMKNNIISNMGSIQQISFIPEHIRNKYKIVWEIPMKHLIDMSADRGVYICQSQSLNLWQEDPNYNTLTSMHFYSWKKGLKTGIYYLRRKAKHQAQQFTLEPEKKEENGEKEEICEMCSA